MYVENTYFIAYRLVQRISRPIVNIKKRSRKGIRLIMIRITVTHLIPWRSKAFLTPEQVSSLLLCYLSFKADVGTDLVDRVWKDQMVIHIIQLYKSVNLGINKCLVLDKIMMEWTNYLKLDKLPFSPPVIKTGVTPLLFILFYQLEAEVISGRLLIHPSKMYFSAILLVLMPLVWTVGKYGLSSEISNVLHVVGFTW